jgi:hypothetical protein
VPLQSGCRTKQRVLHARYEQNPERFVRGRPVVKLPTRFVAINPITLKEMAIPLLIA